MKSTSPSDEEEGEERSAGFVLFRRCEGRRLYLVLRHRSGGHWAFPKGRIEPCEGELAAARREIAEETGIEELRPVPGFRATSTYCFARGDRSISKTVVYFLAEAEAERVRLSHEHSDAAWLEADNAKRRLSHAESRRILDEAEARLGCAGGEARFVRVEPRRRDGRGERERVR
jgi:bis(5'-nucleosidyl)-tetraphosphatase